MKKCIFFILFIFSVNASALASDSLGDLSDKLLLPLSLLTGALYNMSLAIGIALLFGALIQYKNYRNNPSQVPLSRPITLLVFGLILLILPILTKFSESALLVSRVS
ncbi:MAG: Dot/Icm secretion system protein IcmD [Pseudomonadota bacterium]|jgi:intracellular multiplication protein IcmD